MVSQGFWSFGTYNSEVSITSFLVPYNGRIVPKKSNTFRVNVGRGIRVNKRMRTECGIMPLISAATHKCKSFPRNSSFRPHFSFKTSMEQQGRFLPEEDDKFLDKEKRQALAAVNIDAAKDAIATAEEGSCITSERAIYPRHTGNVFHSVATFFSQVMVAIGENTAGPGVVLVARTCNCIVTPQKLR
uniref:Uncharacterized protein n=1 Tax=Cucumis melo TaxID=3656 RepID=A0A9I9EIA6_CUCME